MSKEVSFSQETDKVQRPFRMAISDSIVDIHPIRSRDGSLRDVRHLIFEGLLKFDHQNKKFVPSLAKSYQWMENPLRLRFQLRSGVLFHNDQPFSAQDVKSSFEVFLKGLKGARVSQTYYSNIKEIRVIDSMTVDFLLSHRDFKSFIVIASPGYSPIFSQKQLALSDTDESPEKLLIGTGPYQFETFKPDKFIRLKRSQKWWQDSPDGKQKNYSFNSVEFHFISDSGTQIELLVKNQIDYVPRLDWQQAMYYQGKPAKNFELQKMEVEQPKGYTFIAWNLEHPIFRSKRVRQALNKAFPREDVLDKIFQNAFQSIQGPWFNESELASGLQPWASDLKKASDLLSQDGWKREKRNGVLIKKIVDQKVPFRFELLYAGEEPEAYLTLYQNELKKIGIEMKLVRFEVRELTRRAFSREFEALHMAWAINSFFWEPKPIWYGNRGQPDKMNFSRYQNQKVDQLIDQLDLSVEEEKRFGLLKQIYTKIRDDHPYLFLFQSKFQYSAVSKKIEFENSLDDRDWKYWRFKKVL